MLWHNGGLAGYRTELIQLPEQERSIIVLAYRIDADAVGL